jgi:sugar lactone lactonase YvrE
MYYIDSAESNVCAYNYDLETGSIKNKRVVIQMTEADGAPDGMTMDAEGKVWIAHWGGYKVTRWDPEKGKLLLTQPIPAKQVTSCAFGGPKMDQLYVTTAAHNLDAATLAAHPHTGGLFRFDPGVCGIPAPEFAG